tara:strand:- start:26629 stop:27408 length:780 start_codon:yes stop_codon:yes gene_type:complete
MFYQNKKKQGNKKAVVVLNPPESKRLIAMAVVKLSCVQNAFKKGRIIVIGSTTNAFLVEELIGQEINKYYYAAGLVSEGKLGGNPPEVRLKPFVFKDGVQQDIHPNEMIKEFTADDVYIKSANAVDPEGNAGVLMSAESGGTIGAAIGILNARGSHIITPVGLEKMIPSVIQASSKCGRETFIKAMGDPVGYMPLVNSKVIIEIEALRILSDVDATHIAAGGVNGSEGAVTLVLEGTEDQVNKGFEIVNEVKGEPPIKP